MLLFSVIAICNVMVANINLLGCFLEEIMKSLTRGHVEDIGSTMGIQSYEGQGYEGAMSGKRIATSRQPHLYVMAVLSGARALRVLWLWVVAPG